jgi:hypothetical protein
MRPRGGMSRTCHAFEGSRSSQHNDNAPALHRVFHKLMRASNIG